jgi:tetratricopeptide (TPR) repeat protein
MIDLIETVKWADQFDPSHLAAANRRLIDGIFDAKTPKRQVPALITTVLTNTKASPDPLEYPEALMYCGVAQYYRGRWLTASQHLNEALRMFPQGRHRTVVARYISAWINWQLGEESTSRSQWEEVAKEFQKIMAWYADTLKKIQLDTTVEKSLQIREPYQWLNKWEQTKISGQSRQLIEILKRKLNRKDPTLYQIIARLLELARSETDYLFEAEILVECGLAVYEMENYPQALTYMQAAVDIYHPRTHRQAVARWLLGVVQWQVEPERPRAPLNWEMSIELFEELSMLEDHQGKKDRSKWYEEQLEIMRRAMVVQNQLLFNA